MKKRQKTLGDFLYALEERAKELNCLYQIEELLAQQDLPLEKLLKGVVTAIPPGWQFPEKCRARIRYADHSVTSQDFRETSWIQKADIVLQDRIEGSIEVYYTQEMREADEGPFLKEERKLINTIAERLGHHILHVRLKNVFSEWQDLKNELAEKTRSEWKIVLEMLRRTDQNLYTQIARKMLNKLCWTGVTEACQLMQRFSSQNAGNDDDVFGESNNPRQREDLYDFISTDDEIFTIASNNLSEEEILASIQKWIKDDKAAFLVNAVENLDTSLAEIVDDISKYYHIFPEGIELSSAMDKGLRVSLIRRFFNDQLRYINIAKNFLHIRDFARLARCVIYHQKSHGKLGGKSSGLFLASHILKRHEDKSGRFAAVKIPKTWYVTSDGILNFIHYNNLEEVFNQKYLDIEQVREEYPSIIQVFKNSYFSPEIVNGLSVALDDFGDNPLIVRSSSLLEDSINATFSGKYKSLFLANTGNKAQRLEALLDAIAEVYASTFGPDPIEYRAERGLLDFHEEMGIMIQQVVGTRVGKYFLPAFSGVAFSSNEFRWSPRIRRDDGLLRIVPGLGTRAVDRIGDDYPILLAPGQPNLRVNVTVDEMLRYSPKRVDVINLESGAFDTVEMESLLKEYGHEYPALHQIVSRFDGDTMRQSFGLDMDFDNHRYAVTFNGLISGTDFINNIHAILQLLRETLQTPVDIEFASDGKDLYLLQCRPQGFAAESAPAPIPQDIPNGQVVFTANKFISNGSVPDITHVVYVDPDRYAELPDRDDLVAVGRAVSKLNKLLPKRRFILMGPGRWGSRGDIKLGVNVTYSDIKNTAVLIEIARKTGSYVPDVSFGTHFFQDLVEATIRYIPLYPDDDGVVFNEQFFHSSRNILSELLPEYSHLCEVISVIDVPDTHDGNILRIAMNADLEQAMAYLEQPSDGEDPAVREDGKWVRPQEVSWCWRLRMAERIAALLPLETFGVEALYVFGSTKNGISGPGSDIDLLVHSHANADQKEAMQNWFKGWSLCLAEINYLRTGYRVEELLDVHYVTDEDITAGDSFALKISAVTDRARLLRKRNSGH